MHMLNYRQSSELLQSIVIAGYYISSNYETMQPRFKSIILYMEKLVKFFELMLVISVISQRQDHTTNNFCIPWQATTEMHV